MTRIDFYLLKEESLTARNRYACRIIDKAYQQAHQVYVQVNSTAEAQQLDDLLWTFRDTSFIPHHIYGEACTITPPVQISTQSAPAQHQDILLNLTSRIADHFQQFQRVIEIIPNITAARDEARNTYRCYRDAGCELNLHDLGKAG